MGKFVKFKLFAYITLAAIVISLAVSPALASAGSKMAELFYRDIIITLNGREITPLDAQGGYIEPFIIDGTTYLPVRGVASALGLDAGWDGATNTVMLSSLSDAYYLITASELFDEFNALFGNMYWFTEQSNHLATLMHYEDDVPDFESEQARLGGWIEDGALIDEIIAGAEDLLIELKSFSAPEVHADWFDFVIDEGGRLFDLVNEIQDLLKEMYELNDDIYYTGKGYDLFADKYDEAVNLLYELDNSARDGQIYANEYMKENIY